MTDAAPSVPLCPYCGKPAPEPEKLLGRKVRCGKCRGKYRLGETLDAPVTPMEKPGEWRPPTAVIPPEEAAKILDAMKRETVVEAREELPTVFPMRESAPQPPPMAPPESPAQIPAAAEIPSAPSEAPPVAPAIGLPKEIPSAYFEKYQTRRRVISPETRRKVLEPPQGASGPPQGASGPPQGASGPPPPASAEVSKALSEAARAIPEAPDAAAKDPPTWALRETTIDDEDRIKTRRKVVEGEAPSTPAASKPSGDLPSTVADFKWEAPKKGTPIEGPKPTRGPLVLFLLLLLAGGGAAAFYYWPRGGTSSVLVVPGDKTYATTSALKENFEAVYYTSKAGDIGLPMVYVAVKGGDATIYVKSLLLEPIPKKVFKLDERVLATCLSVSEDQVRIVSQTYNGRTVKLIFQQYEDKTWKHRELVYTLDPKDKM